MEPIPNKPYLGGPDDRSNESGDEAPLTNPVVAYTANGNLEAHSVVTWLRANGVRSHAVEDNSGVSLFAFGTISQFHKPQVFVNKKDLERAGELLRQFEEQRDQRRAEQDNSPPIESECEECGETSEFPASQDGTTQNCPKCNAFMDVGTFDWPEDFDYGEADEDDRPERTADESLDAASRLDKTGDWAEAIAAYRQIGERWPEHANYAANCIEQIQQKIDAVSGT